MHDVHSVSAASGSPTTGRPDAAALIGLIAEDDCETLEGHPPRWQDVVDVHTESDDGAPTPFARALAELGEVAAEFAYYARWRELVPDSFLF